MPYAPVGAIRHDDDDDNDGVDDDDDDDDDVDDVDDVDDADDDDYDSQFCFKILFTRLKSLKKKPNVFYLLSHLQGERPYAKFTFCMFQAISDGNSLATLEWT